MTRGTVTQTRTFLYTESDLTSATNPENGTVTYVYDNSHHVTSRTDALGSKTVYTYDSYGRLSEVQYYPRGSNTEDTSQRVTYYYDGKFPQAYPCFGLTAPSNQYSTGRMSAVVFGGGITDAYHDSYCYQYAYTQPGRVATQQMMVAAPNTYYNSVNFAAGYQWDDEGRMTSLQYPTVTATGSFGGMPANMPIAAMQYDVNGRLNAMTMDDRNGQGPQPFASASYYATGQLNTLLWGGYTETRTYNSLMQLITQSVPGVLSMTYNYSATQNNGRITGSVDGVTGENTTYSYDALNRLTNASNSLWSEAYTYDGFGNLTSKTGSGGSPNPAPTVSMTYSSKNQLTNLSYDANGNQNAWYSPYGGNTYSVENRLTLEVLQNSSPYPANIYAYDPWGKRVMSGYNPNSNSPQPNYNYTFYGITGQKLAMLTCNGSNYPAYPTCAIVGQNVYFGKKLIVAGGVNVRDGSTGVGARERAGRIGRILSLR
jgi:YD repeat-containing protein